MAFKLKYKNVHTSNVTSPIKAVDMGLIHGAKDAHKTYTKVGDAFSSAKEQEEATGGDCYEQELTGEALAKCLENEQKTTDPCDGKTGDELTKCRDAQISKARTEQAEIDKAKKRQQIDGWSEKRKQKELDKITAESDQAEIDAEMEDINNFSIQLNK